MSIIGCKYRNFSPISGQFSSTFYLLVDNYTYHSLLQVRFSPKKPVPRRLYSDTAQQKTTTGID